MELIDYRYDGLTNYPYPIPDHKIIRWFKNGSKSWLALKNEHNLKYRKMFGLDDFRAWGMGEPQFYCDILKEVNSYLYSDLKMIPSPKSTEENILRNIQLSTKCPQCIQVGNNYWKLYTHREPIHNWDVLYNRLLTKGYKARELRSIINDFRKGKDYTLNIELRPQEVIDFIEYVFKQK